MFRRKEENATDPSNPAPVTQAAPSASPHDGAIASSSASAQQPQPGAPSQSSAGSTYVPTAVQSRTAPAASEPARSVAPGASSYRPTPIAEFNRGAARGSSEALRSPAAPSPGSTSFGASTEKTGGGAGKSNRRVLTVGNDILLKGEIATCDRLVIEGRVEAKLSEVHTVEIAECGSFKGTAEVEDAEVSGLFEGDLIVRNRLVIYATGEVRGNISYGEIEIERGGRMTGQIKTAGNAQNGKNKPFDAQQDKPRTSKETAAA